MTCRVLKHGEHSMMSRVSSGQRLGRGSIPSRLAMPKLLAAAIVSLALAAGSAAPALAWISATQTFTTGSTPFMVAVADVNGDNKADLVTPNTGAATVSVLLGNGDGTFQGHQTFGA